MCFKYTLKRFKSVIMQLSLTFNKSYKTGYKKILKRRYYKMGKTYRTASAAKLQVLLNVNCCIEDNALPQVILSAKALFFF